MLTVAHVTHEAVQKIGGIGAVLQGLITSTAYSSKEIRTILIGPLVEPNGDSNGRLGDSGQILYSSIDDIADHPMSEALDVICCDYGVEIVYGKRQLNDPHNGTTESVEVILIDVSEMDAYKVNTFKANLWRTFQLDSSRHEQCFEYELYVRLAEPALVILRVLGAADCDDECVIVAHEFMGVPTALAAKMDNSGAFRTVFYAHEVSAMRRIVEDHPGHDLSFYNVLASDIPKGRYLEDVFGSQDGYHRHALVKTSYHFDKIFAVGDYVARELRFIGPEFADADIITTYNGIPVEQITIDDKKVSRDRLRDYAEILLGDRPDYIFTHVARTAISKGLWRDICVLEYLEQEFRKTGKTAVFFVLSTEGLPKSPEDIREMERWWNWPVAHRECGSDLSGGEALFYQGVQKFNTRSRQIKIVFVNQFGWEQAVCGDRMPADMTFMDIRKGSDVEFGQSVYEPFGISQLETLTFGGICVYSNVCGCAGFVEKASGGKQVPNIIVGDYCVIGSRTWGERKLLTISRAVRDRHESRTAAQVAKEIMDRLPADDAACEQLIRSGYELAQKMSWDVVGGEYVLPAIEAACKRAQPAKTA